MNTLDLLKLARIAVDLDGTLAKGVEGDFDPEVGASVWIHLE